MMSLMLNKHVPAFFVFYLGFFLPGRSIPLHTGSLASALLLEPLKGSCRIMGVLLSDHFTFWATG